MWWRHMVSHVFLQYDIRFLVASLAVVSAFFVRTMNDVRTMSVRCQCDVRVMPTPRTAHLNRVAQRPSLCHPGST